MSNKLLLFPYRTRFVGILLMLASLVFAYMYFWGGKPNIFNIKVYALVSVYIEKRYFLFIKTNILDELAAIFFLVALVLISFSKEKTEKESFDTLRVKALILSLYITLSIWIISFLLIYGIAIFMVSSIIFILFFIVYNILFRYFLFKQKVLASRLKYTSKD
jgi:hypothetical protein